MGQSYSEALRQRVVAFVNAGHSRRAAAEHFSVSPSFAVKLLARHKQCGSLAPLRQGRPPGKGRLLVYRDFLIARVEARPDITMPELAAELEARHGVCACSSSLSRILVGAGFTYKKTLMASERARAAVRKERNLWVRRRQPFMRLQPHRLVFIDETSTNTKMVRLRGPALKGTRLPGSAPWVIEAAMDRKAFDLYVETRIHVRDMWTTK